METKTVNMIEVEGQTYTIERTSSGLYSLDKILGGGMPLRVAYELYGNPFVGKTTLALYLAGKVKPSGKIGVVDLEMALEHNYLASAVAQSGFDGKVKVVDFYVTKAGEKKLRPHEEMIGDAAKSLLDPEMNAIIIDSIGMFTPIAEQEGDIGEAFMGQRARDMAQFTRKVMPYLRIADGAKAAFIVNHVHDELGGRGRVTPGGVVFKYGAAVRLMMYRGDADFPGGCFRALLVVDKLRYGGVIRDENKAFAFVVPGVGISPGMSALLDCVDLGIAERGAYVKLRGKSVGRLKKLVEAAQERDETALAPFAEELKKEVSSGKSNQQE